MKFQTVMFVSAVIISMNMKPSMIASATFTAVIAKGSKVNKFQLEGVKHGRI